MSDEARREIQAAVRRTVTSAGGTMIQRQIFPGRPDLTSTFEEPEPLAGIRAAASLQFEAGQAISRAARYAREDGLTWQQIGEALYPAKPDRDDEPKSIRAFNRLAPAVYAFDSPTFGWNCPDCGGRVSDYGPEAGHPADAERGHADDCKRLAQTVAEWDARWEEDDE